MPSWLLSWHYRSLDERLIAFSNRHIYEDKLVTFPGALQADAITLEGAPHEPAAGEAETCAGEVQRVVAAVMRHAVEHPHDTLGVITMGVKHRDRIQIALDAALAGASGEAAAFFDEQRPDRFFVKNLEQVQGDERDVIFLSVGYGKNATGVLPLRSGPLNEEGGERRLNVAITRARKRMRVFSSFSHLDMDPNRLHARGAKLLRSFLEFASGEGKSLGSTSSTTIAINPFEPEIGEALRARRWPRRAARGVAVPHRPRDSPTK